MSVTAAAKTVARQALELALEENLDSRVSHELPLSDINRNVLVVNSISSSVMVLLSAIFPLLLLLGFCGELRGFSGEEKIPSMGAMPCSSRNPVSFKVIPVFLGSVSL